jgi:hypothetical protein
MVNNFQLYCQYCADGLGYAVNIQAALQAADKLFVYSTGQFKITERCTFLGL